jgi:hypothetical protein
VPLLFLSQNIEERNGPGQLRPLGSTADLPALRRDLSAAAAQAKHYAVGCLNDAPCPPFISHGASIMLQYLTVVCVMRAPPGVQPFAEQRVGAEAAAARRAGPRPDTGAWGGAGSLPVRGERRFRRFVWSVLTEVHLCHACSCQERLRMETARQAVGPHVPEVPAHAPESTLLTFRRVRCGASVAPSQLLF